MKKFTSVFILSMLVAPVFAFAQSTDSSMQYQYKPKAQKLCPNGNTFPSNCTQPPSGTAAADNRNYSASVSNDSKKPMTRLEAYLLHKRGLLKSQGNTMMSGQNDSQYGEMSEGRREMGEKMKPEKKLPLLSISSTQAQCLGNAMIARHTAVTNAQVASQSTISNARVAMINAMVSAYSLSGDAQKDALKSANEAFKSAKETAHKSQKDAVKSASETFRASVTACGISDDSAHELEMGDDMMESPDYN